MTAKVAATRKVRGSPVAIPAVAYVRVSKERDDMISPELQVRAIDAFAAAQGFEIVAKVEDLDLTGTTFDNRSVGKIIEGIRRGEYQAVVLWKWSRWGRNVQESLAHIARVEEVGGQVRSATEDSDASTSSGYLTRGLNLLLADVESRQKSEGWKAVQARRRHNGMPHGGAARFGYTKDGQRFVPDPVTGPALADVYERYVAGEPVQRLVDSLNAQGIRSTRGGPIKANSLLSTLDSGFGAGLMRSRSKPGKAGQRSGFDVWTEGAHEPVISRETWDAYLVRRGVSKDTPTRLRTAAYSLSGLVRCECGARMVAAKASKVTTWRCSAQQDFKGCPLNGTSTRVERLEALVWQWVQDNAQGVESTAKREAERLQREHSAVDAVEALEREVQRLRARRSRLVDLYMDDAIDRPTYELKLATADAELTRTELDRREAVALARVTSGGERELFHDVATHWEAADQHERRELLSTVIGAVIVRKGSHRQEQKCVVLKRWELDSGASSGVGATMTA